MDQELINNLQLAIRQYGRVLDEVQRGLKDYVHTGDIRIVRECAKGLERLGYDGDDHARKAMRATVDGIQTATTDAAVAMQLEVG